MKKLLLALALAWPLMAQTSGTVTATDPTGHTLSVTIQVLPPAVIIIALKCNPSAIQLPATTTSCTLTTSAAVPAGSTPFAVAMTYDPQFSGPSSVTVAAGQSSATFTVTYTPPPSATQVQPLGHTICAPLYPCWAYAQIAVPL
jgi:hypothetical protein